MHLLFQADKLSFPIGIAANFRLRQHASPQAPLPVLQRLRQVRRSDILLAPFKRFSDLLYQVARLARAERTAASIPRCLLP